MNGPERRWGWAATMVCCAISLGSLAMAACSESDGTAGGGSTVPMGGGGSGASGGQSVGGGSGAEGGTTSAGGGGLGGNGGSGGAGGPVAVEGLWTSAAELAGKPTSGGAWDELVAFADADTSAPDVSDQDDPTNVRVLAAAIVYARTSDSAYRDKVLAALEAVVGTEAGGRTLAWGRETGAYALAADLVGYDDADFSTWLRHVSDEALCADLGITLREMFYRRPNNWGSMAFGSLTAIYAYVGDSTLLEDVRSYWVAAVEGPNPGLSYDEDMSWHADESDPRLINPAGSVKQGVDIDGIIPDDMRRGGSFTTGVPGETGYPWEHLQGVLMAARILERQGLAIWHVDQDAIYRAAYALQVRIQGTFVAQGDDLWQLAFLDDAYGTDWSGSQNVWQAGKNAGFAYVLP